MARRALRRAIILFCCNQAKGTGFLFFFVPLSAHAASRLCHEHFFSFSPEQAFWALRACPLFLCIKCVHIRLTVLDSMVRVGSNRMAWKIGKMRKQGDDERVGRISSAACARGRMGTFWEEACASHLASLSLPLPLSFLTLLLLVFLIRCTPSSPPLFLKTAPQDPRSQPLLLLSSPGFATSRPFLSLLLGLAWLGSTRLSAVRRPPSAVRRPFLFSFFLFPVLHFDDTRILILCFFWWLSCVSAEGNRGSGGFLCRLVFCIFGGQGLFGVLDWVWVWLLGRGGRWSASGYAEGEMGD